MPKRKRGRQGDQVRPSCPNCSTPDHEVLCVARGGNAFFTRYYCPNRCGFSKKIMRPGIAKRARQDQE